MSICTSTWGKLTASRPGQISSTSSRLTQQQPLLTEYPREPQQLQILQRRGTSANPGASGAAVNNANPGASGAAVNIRQLVMRQWMPAANP